MDLFVLETHYQECSQWKKNHKFEAEGWGGDKKGRKSNVSFTAILKTCGRKYDQMHLNITIFGKTQPEYGHT